MEEIEHDESMFLLTIARIGMTLIGKNLCLNLHTKSALFAIILEFETKTKNCTLASYAHFMGNKFYSNEVVFNYE